MPIEAISQTIPPIMTIPDKDMDNLAYYQAAKDAEGSRNFNNAAMNTLVAADVLTASTLGGETASAKMGAGANSIKDWALLFLTAGLYNKAMNNSQGFREFHQDHPMLSTIADVGVVMALFAGVKKLADMGLEKLGIKALPDKISDTLVDADGKPAVIEKGERKGLLAKTFKTLEEDLNNSKSLDWLNDKLEPVRKKFGGVMLGGLFFGALAVLGHSIYTRIKINDNYKKNKERIHNAQEVAQQQFLIEQLVGQQVNFSKEV